jgi:hypothetical protein
MSEMIVVDEANQDDMSRKTGIFLYTDTKLWIEDDLAHRADGPAVISPDGVERWYIRGRDMTAEVRGFLSLNKWRMAQGLDTEEKKALFKAHFLA